MFGERGADALALAREVFVLFLPNFVRNLFRLLGCVGQPVMKYIILVALVHESGVSEHASGGGGVQSIIEIGG